jgi:hypothetical protein
MTKRHRAGALQNMNADSIFNIGATHSVCEDYAIARNPIDANPYVILSDGCSTSPDTDIGARLLVRAAEKIIKRGVAEEPGIMHQHASQLASRWARLLKLPAQAIDATLLTAYINNNDEVVVSCSGDGLIVVESIDGRVDAYSFSYPSGYPFYLAYLGQPERLDLFSFRELFDKEILHFHAPSKNATLQLQSKELRGQITEVLRIKTSDCRVVSISSDGLHSFLKTNHNGETRSVEPVQVAEIIRELLSFRSLNGAFVARRMKKFMKECGPKGWQHSDDLSLAAIHLGGA